MRGITTPPAAREDWVGVLNQASVPPGGREGVEILLLTK